MKRFLFCILITLTAAIPCTAQSDEIEQNIFADMRTTDKAAVVAVHFGSAEAEGRRTIDKFNTRLRMEYPEYAFREAWTSRSIINQVSQDGVTRIDTPDELLNQLHKDGYTHILIQSSNMIEGQEMQYLRYVVESARSNFKQIRIGEPLLATNADYEQAVAAATNAYGQQKAVNIFVCHNSESNATPHFTMLDYLLRDKGFTGWYAATIEGFPSCDSVLRQLKSQKLKSVNLIPFIFIAGENVMNSISGEWTQRFEKAGYKTAATLKSLGDLDEIMSIFISHIKHAEQFRTYNAKERKLQRM